MFSLEACLNRFNTQVSIVIEVAILVQFKPSKNNTYKPEAKEAMQHLSAMV